VSLRAALHGLDPSGAFERVDPDRAGVIGQQPGEAAAGQCTGCRQHGDSAAAGEGRSRLERGLHADDRHLELGAQQIDRKRGRRIAGYDDAARTLADEKARYQPGPFLYILLRSPTIRRVVAVSDVKEGKPAELVEGVAQHAESADPRIEETDGAGKRHLPMQKRPKISPRRSSAVNTGSTVSRRPAVSSTCRGMPSIWMCSRSTSRVVPAMAVTMAARNAGEGVEQAGLAGIGAAGDDHRHALAQHRPWRAPVPAMKASSSASSCACTWPSERKVDLLLGEIHGRLHVHAQLDQGLQQFVHPLRELPFQGTHGGAGRLGGAAVDEVGDGLGLGQVELVVEEGAFGELAGAGAAGAQRSTRASSRSSTTGPPWPCSSSTCSPVKECGGRGNTAPGPGRWPGRRHR
jgi:hypothetical protein